MFAVVIKGGKRALGESNSQHDNNMYLTTISNYELKIWDGFVTHNCNEVKINLEYNEVHITHF